MNLRWILTLGLLVWLIVILGYVHWSSQVANADEKVPVQSVDRETATRRLRGAAIEGWTKTAAAAIREGAELDETDEYGTTPLLLASIRGHDRIVGLLLFSGADPNRENDEHVSPLFGAAANCNDPVVTLLLRRGANPNTKNRTRQTALMRAAENGCAVVVKILLQAKGIDLRGTDDTGRTALDYAHESAVLGLDWGDSYAFIDGVRREALDRPVRRPKAIRRPQDLPRGTTVPLPTPSPMILN